MTLDEMLNHAADGAVDVAPGWGQGRATYGGLLSAMLLARAERLVDEPARRLRAASVTFVGPVGPGTATIDVEVLRAGRAATTVAGRIVQAGAVCTTLVATYGLDRDVRIHLAADVPAPAIAAPESIEPIPYIEGIMPEFLQHVELRYASGAPPFSGADTAAFGGWMRFRDAPAQFGDRELMAITDAWPPAVAPLYRGPGPMSTLTWTYEPVGELAAAGSDPAAHWQYDVRTLAASGGYASTTARVWDAAGTLRAISRQTAAYFQ